MHFVHAQVRITQNTKCVKWQLLCSVVCLRLSICPADWHAGAVAAYSVYRMHAVHTAVFMVMVRFSVMIIVSGPSCEYRFGLHCARLPFV